MNGQRLCMGLLIILMTSSLYAANGADAKTATLTVQAHDKDGWIHLGRVDVYERYEEETPTGSETKWRQVAGTWLGRDDRGNRAGEASGVQFKLKPGSYRVRAQRRDGHLELSHETTVRLGNGDNETEKFYFESGNLTVQAHDKDGWIYQGRVDVYVPYEEDTPGGSVTKWRQITGTWLGRDDRGNSASEASGVGYKLKPGTYTVRIQRRDSRLELHKEYMVSVSDRLTSTVTATFECGDVHLQAKVDDGYATQGTIAIQSPYTERTPGGDEERWNTVCSWEIKNADTAKAMRAKLKPGRYRVLGRYTSTDKTPEVVAKEFTVTANSITHGTVDYSSDAISLSSGAADVKYPQPTVPVSVSGVSFGDSKAGTLFSTLTEKGRTDLGLYPGVTGVLVTSEFHGVKPGCVIYSVGGRHIADKTALLTHLTPEKLERRYGYQVPLWFWAKQGDKWERRFKMVNVRNGSTIGLTDIPRESRHIAIPSQHAESVSEFRAWKDKTREEVRRIMHSSDQLQREQVSEAIAAARARVASSVNMEKVKEGQAAIYEAATQAWPIASKIVVRSVSDNATKPEFIYNVSKGVLQGQGVSTVVDELNLADTSVDVLAEEGIISQEQADLARAALLTLDSLKAARDAESGLEIIAALSDGVQGFAELSGHKSADDPNKVNAVLKRGNRIIKLVVDFNRQ